VTSHIGGGHVFVANQSKGTTSNITQAEASKRFSGSWGPEQNEAIDSGGESVIDVFPT
jgi:hypothetical protein